MPEYVAAPLPAYGIGRLHFHVIPPEVTRVKGLVEVYITIDESYGLKEIYKNKWRADQLVRRLMELQGVEEVFNLEGKITHDDVRELNREKTELIRFFRGISEAKPNA